MKTLIIAAYMSMLVALVHAREFSHPSGRFRVQSFGANVFPKFASAIRSAGVKKTNLSVRNIANPKVTGLKALTESSTDSPEVIARRYLQARGFDAGDYVIADQHTSKSNGITHIYFKQVVDGQEVVNGDANISIDRQGRVIVFGDSFHHGAVATKRKSVKTSRLVGGLNRGEVVKRLTLLLKLPVSSAGEFKAAANASDTDRIIGIPEAVGDVPIRKQFIHTPDGELIEVWEVRLRLERNWIRAHLDRNGKLIRVIDWAKDASYQVFPIGTNDPDDGPRQIIRDPAAANASPRGWHDNGREASRTTLGNNVIAQDNRKERNGLKALRQWSRPDGGEEQNFVFPFTDSLQPLEFLDASVTNLFYWNNVMHDIFYQYGFTEEAGNFQADNFGKGGDGNDAVIAFAQDGGGFDNANFITPPDGQNPIMRMYLWTSDNPKRDADFDSGIIIHEYAHGISTRLTGGRKNSGCLPYGEAAGMGEGWGDFFSLVLRLRSTHTRKSNFAVGSYSWNTPRGIRTYLYSTSLVTNPTKYGFLKRPSWNDIHLQGEIWANMLYEMMWALIDVHGYSSNLYDPKAQGEGRNTGYPAGNIMSLQLVVDGMKLQPCRPSFIDARDAILQADGANYDGVNYCIIWSAFAKRGLGVDAKVGGNEAFNIPLECR